MHKQKTILVNLVKTCFCRIFPSSNYYWFKVAWVSNYIITVLLLENMYIGTYQYHYLLGYHFFSLFSAPSPNPSMRPRTSTIGSVSKRISTVILPEPINDGEATPSRKTSLFDSFRPRSKSDATRKLSHRPRVPIVSNSFSTSTLHNVEIQKKSVTLEKYSVT